MTPLFVPKTYSSERGKDNEANFCTQSKCKAYKRDIAEFLDYRASVCFPFPPASAPALSSQVCPHHAQRVDMPRACQPRTPPTCMGPHARVRASALTCQLPSHPTRATSSSGGGQRVPVKCQRTRPRWRRGGRRRWFMLRRRVSQVLRARVCR